MSISTTDCKQAICALVNGANGGTVLAEAYNGTPNIPDFLKHCWMSDPNGTQIPANSIADVITQAGNIKNWKRHEKEKVARVGNFYATVGPKPINLRAFDCRPFDAQLRAYVWDDGNTILRVSIQGE